MHLPGARCPAGFRSTPDQMRREAIYLAKICLTNRSRRLQSINPDLAGTTVSS
jgi:hypothetical protein